MEGKKVVKNVGKGVGAGVKAVYSRSFIIAQIIGLVLTLVGLVIVIIMSQQKFGLTNLKPLFTMITGVVLAIVGLIIIGVSYNIRWKRRMLDRITEIEAHLAINCKPEASSDEEIVEEAPETAE